MKPVKQWTIQGFNEGRWTRMLRSMLPLGALACGIAATQAANAGELVQLPVRDHQTQSIYLEQPSAAPRWVVVLFAGDDGAVGLNDSGPTGLKGNFLIRTATYWSAAGDAAAIFDAPSDQSSGMNDAFRLGEVHAQDIHVVIAALRQRFPAAKIALVGTSRGTISVGNALKREPHDADAYVLTSPVTIASRGQAGLSGMQWDVGTTPVLVVSNENDACRVSPFNAAHALADDSRLQFLPVSSNQRGGVRADECSGKAPHGYLGIESQVLSAIARWLDDPASVGTASR